MDKLQKLQQLTNSGLDNLAALTIAQRLQRLAGEEEGLVSQLRSVITETIGLKTYQLQERHCLMNTRLSGAQELSRDAENIQKEIGRFFDRTRKENYGQVNAEMKPIGLELAGISGLIKDNIAMETMQDLHVWMTKLKTQADMLQPPEADSQSSSAGQVKAISSNSRNDQDADRLPPSAPERVNLHHRTRLLDDSKGTPENHAKARNASRMTNGRYASVFRYCSGTTTWTNFAS